MKILKALGATLVLIISVLALLFYINPQMKSAHTDRPYLKLVEERRGNPPKEEEILQRILLFGDAGHATIDPWQSNMAMIAKRASKSADKTAVVALGDNIYYRGYPRKEEGQQDWDEGQLESISFLDAQLRVAKESKASMFFVPGNHDWLASEMDSQAAHIAAYAEEHNVAAHFEPYEKGEDPLPEVARLNGATLIFLDSEWALAAGKERRQKALDVLDADLEKISRDRPNDVIVVAAHHPLETWGPHGGHLAEFRHWLVMSILYMLNLEAEDTFDPGYAELIKQFNAVFAKYDRVIFAAGHDHNLQVLREPASGGPDYNIVSGAGTSESVSGVWHGENTRFAFSREGFIELNITARGTFLQVFDIDHEGAREGFWLAF